MEDSGAAVAVAEFPSRVAAEGAVADLERLGFNRNEVSLLSQGPPGRQPRNADVIGRRHVAGAVVGLLSGAVIGAAAGAGVSYYRGTRLTDWGGLVPDVLSGLILGAIIGLLLGALTGMGLRRRDPQWYSRQVENARSVVTVMAEARYDAAWETLRRHGGAELGGTSPPRADLAGTAQTGQRPAPMEAVSGPPEAPRQPATAGPMPPPPGIASVPAARAQAGPARTDFPAPPPAHADAAPPARQP